MRKLFLYAALLLLSQCSKCKDNDPSPEEPKLPAETQSGVGALGGRFDNVGFAAKSSTKISAVWACAGNCLSIAADVEPNRDVSGIRFSLNGAINQGATFTAINAQPTGQVGDYSSFVVTHSCDYEATRLVRGQITLTRFDEVARIASGRFACTLYKPGCDTLRVTDGRFDVRF
jgi:hypothetical protein